MASQSNNSSMDNANVSPGNDANSTAQSTEPSIVPPLNGRSGTSRFGGFALAPGVDNAPTVLPGTAAVPPTAAPSPASIYGTVPAFVRELVLGQHDSGHLVPAPPPVSLSVAPPAASPQDQITGLPGSSSGSARSGRGNVPGRGHGLGNSGQGSYGQVRRYPNNANLTATPRVARDNSSSCGSGTIISNRPHDATVAARQVMKQTGATYYASNIQALPDRVRALAAKKHWERTVMYSDSPDRNPPEARLSLDIPRPRGSEVEDDTPAPVTAPVEQSAPEQKVAPKEENDQRGS